MEKLPKVILSKGCFKKVLKLVEKANEESCSLLLGKENDDEILVMDVYHTENVHSFKIVAFRISHEDILKAVMYGRKKSLHIVGVLHTHIGYGARPSAVDISQMVGGVSQRSGVWIIADTKKQEMNAFICINNKVFQIPLEVKNIDN